MTLNFKKITELTVLTGLAFAISGCASMRAKTMKAPCASPSAGLTDPCGNATPINTSEEIDSIYSENLKATPA